VGDRDNCNRNDEKMAKNIFLLLIFLVPLHFDKYGQPFLLTDNIQKIKEVYL
jgi:hypothetical protein